MMIIMPNKMVAPGQRGCEKNAPMKMPKAAYDKALYILSLKLITTHTLSCNFNNTIELC